MKYKKDKIIEELVDKIGAYILSTGNVPSAIIINDKDAKRLFDSMYVRDARVDYKSIKNIKFKDIKIYRTIDIDRGNFKII